MLQNEFGRVPPEVIHLDFSTLEDDSRDASHTTGLRAATRDSERHSINLSVVSRVLNGASLATRSAVRTSFPTTSVGSGSANISLADQNPIVNPNCLLLRSTTSGAMLLSSDDDADVGITPRQEPTTSSTSVFLQPSLPQHASHALPARSSRPPSLGTLPPPVPQSAQVRPVGAGSGAGAGAGFTSSASAITSSRSATTMPPPHPTSSAPTNVPIRARVPSGPSAGTAPYQSAGRSCGLSDASPASKAQQMQLRDVDLDPDTLSGNISFLYMISFYVQYIQIFSKV